MRQEPFKNKMKQKMEEKKFELESDSFTSCHKCHKGRLHYVMLLDNMPHENVHLSHNMHATDLVYISKYSHCHCESLDM